MQYCSARSIVGFLKWLILVATSSHIEVCPAAVRINELVAASSERRLTWDAAGDPKLGTGIAWMSKDFESAGWESVLMPAGYGFSGLATDLSVRMKGKAPSLYLRKQFTASSEHANSTNQLVLSVRYNDGFVAYLNGRQVARANCGSPQHFMFASQPAYNVSTNAGFAQFLIGTARDVLVEGTNVLAIQAHNAEQPSTVAAPEQISRHLLTPEFRIDAGLQEVSTSFGTLDLVPSGPAAGLWQVWVGRVEPSGGVVDMGLVTRSFTPPAGQEDDYETPAEFADWVELFNEGPEAVDLSGWSLTDDRAVSGKWKFPTNTVMASGGYLVVLCDDRDEANAPLGPARRLHTNFKLSDEGEYLGLYDSGGQFVDGFPSGYPPQLSSCSYGRDPGNPMRFGFLGMATPEMANDGPFYISRVEPPRFETPTGEALPGGLYLGQSPVLRLAPSTSGSTVHYSLDGSEPTEAHPLFEAPIPLTQMYEKTGIVVRARAFLPGWVPSRVETHSYLLKQPALLTNSPTMFLSGEAGRVFYAPDGLLAIFGGRFVPVNFGTIWQATGPDSYNNALGSGVPAERETHLEWYFPSGYYPGAQLPLRISAGLRLSTSNWQCPRMRLIGAARNSPWTPNDNTEKPSFNLHFMGDYGGTLNYPVFTNYSITQFKHLRLRAGKNDNLNPFVTDELVRRLWIDMGHVGACGTFNSLYVNGIYKGIYNLCERIREAFFQNHYGSQAEWDVNYVYSWVDGDNVAYQQLLTALDRNLTNLVFYQAVTNRIDVDNAADYYLLNIYCAMWDWPGNNFVIARERSSGPHSRFRFVVWDAEGAFNAVGYGHPASYNTITNDLIVPSGNSAYNRDLPRIFRRLASAPEFRLRFADRVNRHLFNNGILDDRDPDAAGPLKSHFRKRTEDLGREAGNLVRYNTGQGINLSAMYSWTGVSSGRRSYLLGNSAGRQMLRDAGLWPLTEPPVFSQFGGVVPGDFALSMASSVAVTGQTASIYFTLNGGDPRLAGGNLNPAAQTYSEPVQLDQVVSVRARARNNLTGEWSALTEAIFVAGPEPASNHNLAIAELMYHPPGPTATELAAGLNDPDDFEFVRFLNIGTAPVDLVGVQFVQGITFDFAQSPIRYLRSGESVLIVKNRNTFLFRYGIEFGAKIAGEFVGNLGNSGEYLKMESTNQTVLREFAYDDRVPWPESADGRGPSLVLREPESNPDPSNPYNWMASAVPGGLPGGIAPTQTYARWSSLFWDAISLSNEEVSGPSADPDRDGLVNFLEYGLGLDPHEKSVARPPSVAINSIEGEPHLTIQVRLAGGASEKNVIWEGSSDLVHWTSEAAGLVLTSTQPWPDGTSSMTYLVPEPIFGHSPLFIRLRFAGP